MNIVANTLAALWLVAITGIVSVLFLDGLEFEVTGACRECKIVPIFRPDINKMFIAGEIE
jgi:hypothetical protein